MRECIWRTKGTMVGSQTWDHGPGGEQCTKEGRDPVQNQGTPPRAPAGHWPCPPGTQQDSFPWVNQVEPPQPYPVGTGRGHTPRLTRTPPATVRDRPPDGPSQGPHTGSRNPPTPAQDQATADAARPPPEGAGRPGPTPTPPPRPGRGAPPETRVTPEPQPQGGGGRGRWEGAHTNRPTACVCIQCDEHTNTRRQWEDAAPPTAALRGRADGGGGLMGGWKILQAKYTPT